MKHENLTALERLKRQRMPSKRRNTTTPQPPGTSNDHLATIFTGDSTDIARNPDILTEFATCVAADGVVAEVRNSKLLYLALTSRLFPQPVSLVVKGPSSGGKSSLVRNVLRYFPAEAYYELTSMSDMALLYSQENFRHRMLVVCEAEGFKSDKLNYSLRALLSEGELVHHTVQDGRPVVQRVEGPTGLVTTTTATSLHPENETRMLSLRVAATPEQTKAVLRAIAFEKSTANSTDVAPWLSLQLALGSATPNVVIPFVSSIAELTDASGPRMRRDFKQLLTLIKAHAWIHQQNRRHISSGAVVAKLRDYCAVYELVEELFVSAGVAAVSTSIRDTIDAVAQLARTGQQVSGQLVAQKLGIDKSQASRHLNEAARLGFVRNADAKKGRAANWQALQSPGPRKILPTPAEVAAAHAASSGKEPS